MYLDIPNDVAELTKLFENFGERDAEALAMSQLQEGIPQLQRFLFLREAWRRITDDADTTWVDPDVANAEAYPNAPYAAFGVALKRAVKSGVSRQDLTDIARGVKARLLFELCYRSMILLFPSPSYATSHGVYSRPTRTTSPLRHGLAHFTTPSL
jgi:hypothetical protein